MSSTVHDSLAPVQLTQGRAEATLAGETLAGRYDILELLGIGGMGAVYRARDRELDELVALKVVRREWTQVPAMVERFRHEVKLARRVTHTNVARTFELGTADGLTFCTMELVEGESLAQRLRRGSVPVGEAVSIACAVCDGLAAAHAAGVVHRDIKPDNILIAHDGRVVVADFGVAAATAVATGELSGTPAYMAPEQARGDAASPSSDVFSLAVVLREMIGDTGPAQITSVIAHATAADRKDRIASARAFRHALEPWTQPLRRVSQPMRAVPSVSELATVVVLPPFSRPNEPRQYLATAVHEETLGRLAKTPRLRVLPRVTTQSDRPTFGIQFDLTQTLDVWITLEQGAQIVLHFPVGIEHVHATANAVVSTIDAELGRMQHHDERGQQALDKMLRARHIGYRDVTLMPEAITLLLEARALAPEDSRIAATLAIAYIRQAFFRPSLSPTGLADARMLATAAVIASPQLADGHIALGHLELTAGKPVLAASHFRIAIARAPHLAEAHEQLGRMLLEAGYIDLALARLDEALAIAPDLRSAKWEVSRSYALDGRWEDLDRSVSELRALGLDRPLSRARYAWWRGDSVALRELRDSLVSFDQVLFPGVMRAMFAVFLDRGTWAEHKPEVIAAVHSDTPNLRRRVFVAQLACETAAFAGDTDSMVELLEYAAAHGLFDLHWLERCPLLQPYQQLPGLLAVRTQIAARAVAILDALYGDHAVAMSETQVA